mgnify:CR=1 FL=1
MVNEVIRESHIVLFVLDARFWDKSRNREIEKKLKQEKKRFIYVLNKADLLHVPIDKIKLPLKHYVFVSAKENLGTTRLRDKINKLIYRKPCYIGVVGYPNTGKSSLINVLLHRHGAPTSPSPGFTKGKQKLRLMTGVYLLDTPGVIPEGEDEELFHSLMNVRDVTKIKNPDLVAREIISFFLYHTPENLSKFYTVELTNDAEEMFDRIGRRLNILKKKGELDVDKVSRKIILDWQRGRLK